MAKPRMIIADTDESYIVPLQLKFAKDYSDVIDIEIITDKEYYEELFEKPQKADILIVSDELYDVSIQRHNIINIFVMMEQYEEEETGDLNVIKLFKYTSIKEIFNEVIGRSVNILNIENKQKQETKIVVVTSAAGGVGKTTVAMGISACLTKNYKKVLYINASRLQAFQYMLDNQAGITSPDIYTNLNNVSDNIYERIKYIIRKEIFSYVPAFKASLISIGLDFSVYEKIAVSAKNSGDFDFIIVDLENSFDSNMTGMLDIADKVIVVVDQTLKVVYCTNQWVSNISGINSDKYTFVCNDFDREMQNALIRPDIVLNFNVEDYIEHIKDYETKKINDYISESGIQKIAFLVL